MANDNDHPMRTVIAESSFDGAIIDTSRIVGLRWNNGILEQGRPMYVPDGSALMGWDDELRGVYWEPVPTVED